MAYDGLLLVALWMGATLIEVLLRDALRVSLPTAILQAVLFLIGLGFFGWFWSHGGQTLGMRAWRLRVQIPGGAPLPLTKAALRYMAGLLPLIAALWGIKYLGTPAAGIAALGYLPCLLDRRSRALNDFVAGTEMVLLAQTAASADPPEAPERSGDQQQGRRPG